MKTETFNAEAVAKYITQWLKSYAEQAGIKGFVVGISGGIDSAVTSSLCALTGLPTLCVELPIHQSKNQLQRSTEHINYLKKDFKNVSSASVDLSSTFDSLQKELPTASTKETLDLTLANTRSRLRMTTLYYFAGINSSLVVGTGNKIEDFGVGFFTKYGDGGVDISPIADLLKSEVTALGVYLNVPKSIIDAKPTDGLFGDDRSDEDQLGANYDELEEAMYAKEQGKTAKDFTGRAKEVFEIYEKLNKANQHKVNPIPVCIISKEIKHSY